jgi:hypothetical protein
MTRDDLGGRNMEVARRTNSPIGSRSVDCV